MATHPDFDSFAPKHAYFIGIDSDGCVFDSMELKHKECFIPNIIKEFHLQGISKYTRAAAEFVNLYSKWRGFNRFPAMIKTFDLLAEWPEVRERKPHLPPATRIRRWLDEDDVHSNDTLKGLIEQEPDCQELKDWLQWSLAVNKTVEYMVHDLPPFPSVIPTLQLMNEQADCCVVSSTPGEALAREWAEHSMDPYVQIICGQEHGKKKDHIAGCTQGRYAAGKVLMIGDAPGDRKAAVDNDALFYPILPGHEEQSWKRLHDEALAKFFDGSYAGAYADALIREFEDSLPETPPWQQ